MNIVEIYEGDGVLENYIRPPDFSDEKNQESFFIYKYSQRIRRLWEK